MFERLRVRPQAEQRQLNKQLKLTILAKKSASNSPYFSNIRLSQRVPGLSRLP
jgi:hypothetical protein